MDLRVFRDQPGQPLGIQTQWDKAATTENLANEPNGWKPTSRVQLDRVPKVFRHDLRRRKRGSSGSSTAGENPRKPRHSQHPVAFAPAGNRAGRCGESYPRVRMAAQATGRSYPSLQDPQPSALARFGLGEGADVGKRGSRAGRLPPPSREGTSPGRAPRKSGA